MTTSLLMLFLMAGPYLIGRLRSAFLRRPFDVRASAAVGLGLLFSFTALGHFVQMDPLARMLPPWVPGREVLVWWSGVLELTIAAGFFVPRFRRLAAWAACLLLVGFFPLNVYAAIARVPVGGHEAGPLYLLVRAPLQAAILFWSYRYVIRGPRASRGAGEPLPERGLDAA
jgi:uncharacterized membrane protein